MSETDPQGEINPRRVRYEWNSNPQKYQCPAHSILHKAKQAQPPLSPQYFWVGGSQHYGIWSQNFPNMNFDKGNAIVYQVVQKFQSTNTLGFATLFVLFVCYHCVITPPSATLRLLLKRIKPIFSQRILKIENWNIKYSRLCKSMTILLIVYNTKTALTEKPLCYTQPPRSLRPYGLKVSSVYNIKFPVMRFHLTTPVPFLLSTLSTLHLNVVTCRMGSGTPGRSWSRSLGRSRWSCSGCSPG